MESLPEECVVHALGFLELEDVIDFTRTTKDASALVTKHDKSLFEPALQRLHAWRQGVGRLENEGPPLHERRVPGDGQRTLAGPLPPRACRPEKNRDHAR